MALHSRKEREAIMREIRQRRGDPRHGFVREMRLLDGDGDEDLGYASGVPAVAALRDGLQLDPRVTFLAIEQARELVAQRSRLGDVASPGSSMLSSGSSRWSYRIRASTLLERRPARPETLSRAATA